MQLCHWHVQQLWASCPQLRPCQSPVQPAVPWPLPVPPVSTPVQSPRLHWAFLASRCAQECPQNAPGRATGCFPRMRAHGSAHSAPRRATGHRRPLRQRSQRRRTHDRLRLAPGGRVQLRQARLQVQPGRRQLGAQIVRRHARDFIQRQDSQRQRLTVGHHFLICVTGHAAQPRRLGSVDG